MIKYYRKTKPLCGSQLDVTHPLAPNAVCLLYNEGNGRRINNLALPLPATMDTNLIAATWKGQGYFYNTTVNNRHLIPASPMFHNTQKMSWAFRITPQSIAAIFYRIAMCGNYSPTSDWAWAIQMLSGKLFLYIPIAGSDVGSTNYVGTTNVVFAVGKSETVVVTFDGNLATNKVVIYIFGNNISLTTVGTISSTVKTVPLPSISLGILAGAATTGNHYLDYYYQWYDRVLTPLEAQQISAQPYQFIVQDWIDYDLCGQMLVGGNIPYYYQELLRRRTA